MESNLAKLKKEYSKLEKKFSLPSFETMNSDFDIEKIERETDFLEREIRRTMSEKIAGTLRFVELMLSPSQAPFFILLILKNFEENTKKNIERLYKELSSIEIESVILDLDYDQKKEIEFIKNTYKKWQKIKKELKELGDAISKAWKDASDKKQSKDYFG